MSTAQPRVGPQYATLQQFKDFVGQSSAPPELDPHFRFLIRSASDTMDRKTGRWFNQRSVTITTHGKAEGSNVLMLPQRIVELTSVTEDGDALTEDDDFYRFDSYLEKPWAGLWNPEPWTIVVVGKFGEPSPTDEIAELCCAIGAAEGKYEKRTFINEDGSATEVPISSYKKWVDTKIEELRWKNVDPNSFRVAYP